METPAWVYGRHLRPLKAPFYQTGVFSLITPPVKARWSCDGNYMLADSCNSNDKGACCPLLLDCVHGMPLTCYIRKSTSETCFINDGYIPSSAPVSHNTVTVNQREQYQMLSELTLMEDSCYKCHSCYAMAKHLLWERSITAKHPHRRWGECHSSSVCTYLQTSNMSNQAGSVKTSVCVW